MARGARSNGRLDTALVVACVLAALTLRSLAPARRDPIARAVRETFVAPLLAGQSSVTRSERALREAAALRRATDSLTRLAQGATALAAENATLRGLLGLAPQVAWGYVVAEALPASAPGGAATRLLSIGARDSIAPLSPVVTAAGVAGLVATVDDRSAVMLTWAHPDFRVSAMSEDAGAVGIVTAHASNRGGEGLLELTGVPFRTLLAPGTLIVSSGLGGVFPAGVPVGKVLRVLSDEGGWVRSYLVDPAVPLPSLSGVLVLRAPRVRAGLDSVWSR
ncbi:MAG: rod shape-determining protein MreC [Gemmatimonadota bacterium]|nr:rod shape-determining protein MreC [Gemmatimonadota bacterium]MDQ8147097.1 rod shape-determining protein MreC [Gemmatimonadota bacterium]MDQ8148675.1 rod shape-determining protein MreC [Gemmatimonadota bacterium]MDQ8176367.1 rod shape-determining protein MreC [Gemmatimonadota bacterium]